MGQTFFLQRPLKVTIGENKVNAELQVSTTTLCLDAVVQ